MSFKNPFTFLLVYEHAWRGHACDLQHDPKMIPFRNHLSYMSEEKNKDDETVKKVGTISYCAYEEAATYDWTQVKDYGPLPLHRDSSSV